MSSYWLDNAVVSAGTGYLATLNLDMGVVSQGITSEQLSSATLSGGVIVISSVSNTALYKTILNNLAGGMNVQFVPTSIIRPGTDNVVSVPDPAF